MSNNISVSIRVRPLLPEETQLASNTANDQELFGDRSTVRVLDERVLVFARNYAHGSRRNKEAKYAFDKVFSENASQQSVFEGTTLPLVPLVLDGFNATVFAYGATGCGKTHTISGTHQDPGIIYRTMQHLFLQIEDTQLKFPTTLINVTVSYLEVYNETIRDLLVPQSQLLPTSSSLYSGSTAVTNSPRSLDIREDDENRRVFVQGLSEHCPATVDQVLQLMDFGNANRVRAPTEANAVSSRSHAVLQVCVKRKDTGCVDGGFVTGTVKECVKVATLSIIDLAGSERASATKNHGERMLEGANINRSLLALGNCINALCSDKPNHIPYRDSKLTRLLKYSLSGSCKVVMITNISPARIHYEETQNTLKYANRAKNISTKLVQNIVNVDSHVSQYVKIIESLRCEVEGLKKKIHEKSGIVSENSAIDIAVIKSKRLNAVPSSEISLSRSNSMVSSSSHTNQLLQQPQRTEFQNLQVYNFIIKRLSKLFEKIRSKMYDKTVAESKVAQNERRENTLMSLVMHISSNTTASQFEFNETLNATVSTIMDKLSNENVRLRHNATEYGAAIDRYRSDVADAVSASTVEQLSLLYREKVEATLVDFEDKCVSYQNELLVKVLQDRLKIFDDVLDSAIKSAVESLCTFGKNVENTEEQSRLELVLEKFAWKGFGVSIKTNRKSSIHSRQTSNGINESDQQKEEWVVDNSVSECNISLNYDCISETESECGDAPEEMGNMENLLDEMEEDEQFTLAFENIAPTIGNLQIRPTNFEIASQSDSKTPLKVKKQDVYQEDEKMDSDDDDDNEPDEPTPMAKIPTRRESSMAISSPVFRKSANGKTSLGSSMDTTPVASFRSRLFELANATEPTKDFGPFSSTGLEEESKSFISTQSGISLRPRTSALAKLQSMLPILKQLTPVKKAVTAAPKTATAIPISRRSSMKLSVSFPQSTETRDVRKQGAVRATGSCDSLKQNAKILSNILTVPAVIPVSAVAGTRTLRSTTSRQKLAEVVAAGRGTPKKNLIQTPKVIQQIEKVAETTSSVRHKRTASGRGSTSENSALGIQRKRR
ncbi:kinesin-like protein Klp5, partial [Physocladia obscura]